ncbi:Non-specific lipid-transfer protein [Bienertia sinuspersici]
MASSSVVKVACAVLMCMVMVAPLAEAAVTCGLVSSKVAPCIATLREGQPQHLLVVLVSRHLTLLLPLQLTGKVLALASSLLLLASPVLTTERLVLSLANVVSAFLTPLAPAPTVMPSTRRVTAYVIPTADIIQR